VSDIKLDVNIKDNLDYYNYDLPKNLIANSPTKNRSDSKLLCINREDGLISHNKFKDIINFLKPNDLLVLNESKVMQARLYGLKSTGGKIELLVERIENDKIFLAQVKSSKPLKKSQEIFINKNIVLEIIERSGVFYRLKLSDKNLIYKNIINILDDHGRIPLPPYMEREDQDIDKTRYQTVYAKTLGSAAAPTAGLHFDSDLLKSIEQKGVDIAKVTLHVGAGTFTPVRSENIKDHKMHSEFIECPQSVCDKINKTKKAGGRVISVGTTSMRVLESVASFNNKPELSSYSGETDIFIYPGYKFKVVDALITNFHLPKSSLLMLVYAFGGDNLMKEAYKISVLNNYRFFSYGDAMLII
jgi:S-adenosylmethionine:tRNA ribosyltransferase-isomerase